MSSNFWYQPFVVVSGNLGRKVPVVDDVETYNTKARKKEHKEEAKVEEEETAEEDAPVPLVTHVTNLLHSIFSNVEVYINNQQIYNCNGLYAHQSYISNNFKVAISENKGVRL